MEILTRRILACLVGLLLACPAMAQDVQLAEQKIKAGMLYNFLKYTDWPAADAAKPMRVCLYGDDPFDSNLQPMQGRSVDQRLIEVKLVQKPAELASCQLLVIPEDKRQSWPDIHRQLATQPVLTVSDSDGFVEAGGMIAFGHRDNHIEVVLNQPAVKEAGLTVQERLLHLVTLYGGQ